VSKAGEEVDKVRRWMDTAAELIDIMFGLACVAVAVLVLVQALRG
jgi:hypothetical protein